MTTASLRKFRCIFARLEFWKPASRELCAPLFYYVGLPSNPRQSENQLRLIGWPGSCSTVFDYVRLPSNPAGSENPLSLIGWP